MTALLRALRAEALKIKRTLALWLVLIGPLSVVAFATLIFMQSSQFINSDTNPWQMIGNNSFGMWAILALPLFIALETALLGQLEHGNAGWKQIFAQPNPRWATYIAKQAITLGVIGLSQIALIVEVILAVVLMRALNVHPDVNYGTPIPWAAFARAGLFSYVAAWLIIAIHTWVGLRWPNFAVAIAAGVVASVAGFMAANGELGWYFPWSIAALSSSAGLRPEIDAHLLPVALTISIVGTLIVSVLGSWDVTRQDAL